MSPFTRFAFILLLAASVIAFGIVLHADIRSQSQQATDMAAERQRFADIINQFNSHLRHGEIAVEWQKTDATQQVVQTSLLVRIYSLDSDGNEIPLPIVRVLLPHNRVNVDGLMLDFDVGFPEEYKALRGARLAFFDHIYADEQGEPNRFSLLTPDKPPRATQIHPDRVTQFESELWHNVWDMILNEKLAAKSGLKVTWVPAATRAVTIGSLYSIYMGFDGIKMVEDNDPALLRDMLREAAQQDAAATRPATAAP